MRAPLHPLIMLLIMFIGGEISAAIIFQLIAKTLYGSYKPSSGPAVAIFKGALERLVLFIGLINDYSSILIAFAAIRLGTRIFSHDKSTQSNDFFLVGTLISFLITFAYVMIAKRYII